MTFIINANIQTMADKTFHNGVIQIRDGKIVFIGEQHVIPEGAPIIDAKGALVTPGLIDVHTHIGIDEEGVGWEGDDFNETSEAVTPHVRALDGMNSFDQGFFDAARSGVTAIQVLPGSANVIGGLTASLKVKIGRTADELVIQNPSGLKIAFGENPKRIHGKAGKAPVTRMGVASLLRDQLVKAQTYMEKREKGQCDRDLRLEALTLVLKREIPVRAHTHRADDIMTAIRIAKEFNLKLSIEHATEGHKVAQQLAASGVSVTIGPTLSSRSKVELKEIGWETYKVLSDVGIEFAMITDHPIIPINYLTTSARMAIREGLDEMAAWRSLTINPATIVGVQERLGTLEVGKDADLVIWEDNPITSDGRPYLTMVDGDITYESPLFK